LFVIVVGGFDLSVGSLITLTVMGSALRGDRDMDERCAISTSRRQL
jgi:ribose/xylose/arabinose/galactoside ABC-type transport system permease subunit